MKKILSISFFLVHSFIFSQMDYEFFPKIKYDLPSLTDYIVVEVDSLSQSELYIKTINWIKETYKNPDEVIKTTFENEKIRIEGYEEIIFSINSIGMIYNHHGTYVVEISFKDGKYKFDPISAKYYQEGSQFSSGGDVGISINDLSVYYNKKGKLRSMYKQGLPLITETFNTLNYRLYYYLSSKKDNEW
ncbi:DUF4468 domain-containing protein [Abyssalbus ytuae]|uniref:DUF4468 domain-containing protein n=1 Tax=Abyssalbus ytuae TaxID=2926907 RepID=A0A9E7CYF2_9FLAO|nr:DUF4468 domain-containing protein [Abyssalbus ytuae]UOB16585.1 DUF4468 domain-containing protein [Abyssalbus ytuae]